MLAWFCVLLLWKTAYSLSAVLVSVISWTDFSSCLPFNNNFPRNACANPTPYISYVSTQGVRSSIWNTAWIVVLCFIFLFLLEFVFACVCLFFLKKAGNEKEREQTLFLMCWEDFLCLPLKFKSIWTAIYLMELNSSSSSIIFLYFLRVHQGSYGRRCVCVHACKGERKIEAANMFKSIFAESR